VSERIRFQADEDLETQIIKGLRRRQPLVDFETIPAAGLRGKHDSAVLAFAAYFIRPLEVHTPMREFLNPPCRFCRVARITGLSIGVLAVLFLLVGFILTR